MTKLSEQIKIDKYIVMKSRTKRAQNFYAKQLKLLEENTQVAKDSLYISRDNNCEGQLQTRHLESIASTLKYILKDFRK